MMLRGRLRDAAQQPMASRGAERAIRQQHRHRSRAAGERGERVAEQVHAAGFEHALDHDVVDLASRLAGDDQAGPDLAQLDAVGDVDHAVEHAQAGVADVVDGGGRADAQAGGDVAGSRRLELLAADAGIDQRVDRLRRGTSDWARALRAAAMAPCDSG